MKLAQAWYWFVSTAAVLACAAICTRVWAGGVPEMAPLTYAGTLQDAAGKPLTGSHNVQVLFWKTQDMAGGGPACQTRSMPVELLTSGHFSVELPGDCTEAVKTHPELWIEVIVDGGSLGTERLGAVPYALEAHHASSADAVRAGTSLASRLNALAPPKAIVSAYLSADDVAAGFDETGLGRGDSAYAGWAICNGENGTPSLDGRFTRMSTIAAGAMGGSDSSEHTHAIDHDHGEFSANAEAGHTHVVSGHRHFIPIGFDQNNMYLTSGDDGLPAFDSDVISRPRTPVGIVGPPRSAATRLAYTQPLPDAPSGAGSSHTHVIDPPVLTATSGTASASDNRPAFTELVPLMRL